MDLNEMEADLQRKVSRATKPWMRVGTGILLLLVLGGLLYYQLTSPLHLAKRKTMESEKFGEALERAGIATQAGPSK